LQSYSSWFFSDKYGLALPGCFLALLKSSSDHILTRLPFLWAASTSA